MKALTLWQPFAQLVAIGAKKIETRSWATKYRGPIAIHAAKNRGYEKNRFGKLSALRSAINEFCITPLGKIPYGSVIAIADLVDCVEVESAMRGIYYDRIAILKPGIVVRGNELAFGDYTPGRYAWILKNVRRIKPVPAKGLQRLWNWEPPEQIDNCPSE